MFLGTFARLSSTFVQFYKTMPNDPGPPAITLDTPPNLSGSTNLSQTHTHIPPYIHHQHDDKLCSKISPTPTYSAVAQYPAHETPGYNGRPL